VSHPSVEIERALIGSVIIDGELIKQVRGVVTPEDFVSPVCRTVFQAMLSLDRRDFVVDWATVVHEMGTLGVLEDVGGKATLTGLINCAPSSLYGVHYAELVAQAALERRGPREQSLTEILDLG
jgi:replicative DNA helicase